MDIRNPSLNLGVKIIDRDHAEISEMMLDLRLGLAQGKPSSLTSAFLRNLARATASHFALEEAMMEAAKYTRLPVHRLRHRWMLDQMQVLTARCRKVGLHDNAPLLDLMSEAHFTHVQNEDLSFGLWLDSPSSRCQSQSIRG